MAVFEVVSGGDRGSLIKRFERKSKHDAVSELVDFHLLNCTRIEKLEAKAQALREEVAALRARVVVDEHAEFERLFSIYKMKRHHHGTGGYTDFTTHCVFEAFQAGVRLNGKAVSEGLLRRTLEFIKATNYQGSIPLGLIAELSELLGEGKEYE